MRRSLDRRGKVGALVAAVLLAGCGSATLPAGAGGAAGAASAGRGGAAGAGGAAAGGRSGGTGGAAGSAGAVGAAGAAGVAGAAGSYASGGAGAGTAGAAGGAPGTGGGPACGERGQACCAGAMCSARATCDGTACIASDVWASELDGTFEFTGATWTQPLLSGTSQSLPAMNALWGTSPTFAVGAGNAGSLFQNTGTGWHKQTVGNPNAAYYGIAGSGSSDVWAVGDVYFAHWNGSTWTPTPAPSGANGNPFYSVWLSGPGAGWAVGEQAVYAQLSAGAWTFVGHSSNGYAYHGVWGSSAKDVYIVGNGHSIAGVGNPLLVEHYDGTAWTDISSTIDPSRSMSPLNAVWGTDATHVWAVGDGGNVLFWNGTLWKPLLSGAASTESLSAIWGSGPADVWVAGSGGVRHFNGTAWSKIPGLNNPTAIWLSPN